ncbi:hypothetical protein KJ885_01465 [Patescibacteria group bacterium]|nr:hypothetical protein [Patescibacteria group bacterium]
MSDPNRESAKKSTSAEQHIANLKSFGFSKDEVLHGVESVYAEKAKESKKPETKTPAQRPGSGISFSEVMILLAILGIMAAVTIPAYQKYIRQNKTLQSQLQKQKPEKIPVNQAFLWQDVVIRNTKQIEVKANKDVVYTFEYGQKCEIPHGFVEKLGKFDDRILVRFTCSNCWIASEKCPNNSVFFVDKDRFEKAERAHKTEKEKKDFVKKTLSGK